MAGQRFNSGQVQGWGANEKPNFNGLFPAYNGCFFNLNPSIGSNNAFLGTLNQMTLTRINVISMITISKLNVQVTTAGGGSAVVRMGIYESDPATGRPAGLIIDGGTASATTIGIKEINITQILQPGNYYVACVAQDWTTTRPDFKGNLDLPVVGFPSNDQGPLSVGAATACVAITGVSGALPNPAGTLATSTENRRVPTILVGITV